MGVFFVINTSTCGDFPQVQVTNQKDHDTMNIARFLDAVYDAINNTRTMRYAPIDFSKPVSLDAPVEPTPIRYDYLHVNRVVISRSTFRELMRSTHCRGMVELAPATIFGKRIAFDDDLPQGTFEVCQALRVNA